MPRLIRLFHDFVFLSLFVFFIRGGLAEVLCKPKIMPIKSAVLEQLQRIETAAEEAAIQAENTDNFEYKSAGNTQNVMKISED
jgi:hypothetical protein